VQGCVVGPRAVIGAGTALRECLVAAEYEAGAYTRPLFSST